MPSEVADFCTTVFGHAAAIETLTQAQGKAHGLQDDALVSKLGDLIEWQEGLLS